jgi:hypothetical protein
LKSCGRRLLKRRLAVRVEKNDWLNRGLREQEMK